jgi:predicted transcriptional regulator
MSKRKNKWIAVKLLLEDGFTVKETAAMMEMTRSMIYQYIKDNSFNYKYERKRK